MVEEKSIQGAPGKRLLCQPPRNSLLYCKLEIFIWVNSCWSVLGKVVGQDRQTVYTRQNRGGNEFKYP